MSEVNMSEDIVYRSSLDKHPRPSKLWSAEHPKYPKLLGRGNSPEEARDDLILQIRESESRVDNLEGAIEGLLLQAQESEEKLDTLKGSIEGLLRQVREPEGKADL